MFDSPTVQGQYSLFDHNIIIEKLDGINFGLLSIYIDKQTQNNICCVEMKLLNFPKVFDLNVRLVMIFDIITYINRNL